MAVIVSLIPDSLSVTTPPLIITREESGSPFLYTGDSGGLMYTSGRYGDVFRDGVGGDKVFYNNVFPIDVVVRLSNSDYTISDGVLGLNIATDVFLTPDSLSVSDLSLNVNVEKIATLIPDSMSIADGSLFVKADIDTNVDLTGDTLSLSDGSVVVQADVDTNVSLTSDSAAITDGSLYINVEKIANLIPSSLSISDGSLTITYDRKANLAPQALTITDGTLSLTITRAINLNPESITLTDESLSVKIGEERFINLTRSNISILRLTNSIMEIERYVSLEYVSEEEFLNSGDLPPQYGAEFIQRSPRRGASASRVSRSGARSTTI